MKFKKHKYVWERPFGSVRHDWSLVGPEGAVNFHVSENEKYGDSAGLEFHHTRALWMRIRGHNEAPHHCPCPLLGEPCWHDGTSLYAEETIWPIVKAMLRGGDHDAVFQLLEREYLRRFEKEDVEL